MYFVRNTFFLLIMLTESYAWAVPSSTLTVNGLVSSSTCSVDIDGMSESTVNMNKFPVSDFTGKGIMLGGKEFSLNFNGCESNGDGFVHMELTPLGIISAIDKTVLLPSSGTAQNVGFAFTSDDTGSSAIIFEGSKQTSRHKWKVDATGRAKGLFKVYYKSLDIPVRPGTLKASMMATIIYH